MAPVKIFNVIVIRPGRYLTEKKVNARKKNFRSN